MICPGMQKLWAMVSLPSLILCSLNWLCWDWFRTTLTQLCCFILHQTVDRPGSHVSHEGQMDISVRMWLEVLGEGEGTESTSPCVYIYIQRWVRLRAWGEGSGKHKLLALIALSRTFSFLSSKAFEKQRGQLKRKVALMGRDVEAGHPETAL